MSKKIMGDIYNRLTPQSYQEMLDGKFGVGIIEVLKFTSFSKPIIVKCSRCGDIKEYPSGYYLKTARYACQNCNRQNMTKDEFQSEIDEIFGANQFTIIKFETMDKPIALKHKCGFVANKKDSVKARNMLECPTCKIAKSKGRIEIARTLLNMNISFSTEKLFKDLKGVRYQFAIDLRGKPLLIEFDNKDYITASDRTKDDYCIEHNYPILWIPYWEFKHIKLLILNFLKFNDYPLGE